VSPVGGILSSSRRSLGCHPSERAYLRPTPSQEAASGVGRPAIGSFLFSGAALLVGVVYKSPSTWASLAFP
jgi:hypothetical protein